MALVDPYRETVRLSPNKGGDIAPRFIVLHHSCGSFHGDLSWIANPASKVSYHYLIDPDTGNRVQLVRDSKKAWHAGKSKWKGIKGLNSHSIGIAFTGDTHKRTPANHEIESVAHKCLYIMRKFSIPRENILTHAMIAPGRKDDCSPETHQAVLDCLDCLL